MCCICRIISTSIITTLSYQNNEFPIQLLIAIPRQTIPCKYGDRSIEFPMHVKCNLIIRVSANTIFVCASLHWPSHAVFATFITLQGYLSAKYSQSVYD